MNSRQLQYAILLSQVKNFSQVAEQLNITQPALSKQILALEKDLGIKLFDRNTSPLSLTPAGEYFIQEAQDLIYKEDQLLHGLDRFKSGENGKLVIGISPFRCMYLIPQIVKQIREKFPGVHVVLHEIGSDTLRKEAAEGRYDFAIANLPVDETILEVIPLEPDTLVLAVPNVLCKDLPGLSNEETAQICFSDCRELPFVVVGQNQEMRQLFNKFCTSANFHPNIVSEVVGLTSAWALAHAGVGATLLPLQFFTDSSYKDNLRLFTLTDNLSTRQPVIIRRKGQYLSKYAKYAIHLLSAQIK